MPLDWMQLISQWNWTLQAFVVVLVALVADFVQRGVLLRLQRRLERTTRNVWDGSLAAAARTPLSGLIWIVGIAFAAEIARKATQAAILDAVAPLRALGVIAMIAWFLIRFARNVERRYAEQVERAERAEQGRLALDAATVVTFGKLIRISVIVVGVLVALQTMGFSISGVLAFGGVGGIVVGFAAKDLLANFFGGLMIFLERPFAVGDWVRSPDREIEGIVERISWRLTRIRTFDKRPLYVPNAVFSTITVENGSRMTHRRIREWVGVRYDDAGKIAAIAEDVKAMLAQHPRIDPGQTPVVAFERLAPSSLDILIQAFSPETDYARFEQVKQDILLKVIAIVTRHGAEIAFPTSTVHVPEGIAFKEEGEGHMKWPVEIESRPQDEEEYPPSWRREREEEG